MNKSQILMTPLDCRAAISQLYNSLEFCQLTEYYETKSVWEVIGIARKENQHSKFLAWLFNPYESHGLGVAPLRRFLRSLVSAKHLFTINSSARLDKDIESILLIGDYEVANTQVNVEVPICGSKTIGKNKENAGRIDILLLINIHIRSSRLTLPVIIENKVFSTEHKVKQLDQWQTTAYYNWAEEQFKDDQRFCHPIYVFLTADGTYDLLNGTDRAQKCDCLSFLHVNYQFLAEQIVTPLLTARQQCSLQLKDYLRCLSVTEEEMEDCDVNRAMASSGEELSLCRKLWEKNQKLFMTVLAAVSDDPESDMDSDTRELVARVVDNVAQKDLTKYRVNGSDRKLPQGRMVLEVVKTYCVQHIPGSLTDLKQAFPDKLQGSIGVVVSVKDNAFLQKPGNYFNNQGDHIELKDGTEVAVCRQWGRNHGSGNIPAFVEHARSLKFIIEEC